MSHFKAGLNTLGSKKKPLKLFITFEQYNDGRMIPVMHRAMMVQLWYHAFRVKLFPILKDTTQGRLFEVIRFIMLGLND